MAQVGEALHAKGADGAQRAKYWLDATTRTKSTWTNEDEIVALRMSFEWTYPKNDKSKSFSFDLGGILFGDPFHDHIFVAEVKNYSTVGSLGTEFDHFLAKCYQVALVDQKNVNQFMFITWNPFRANEWKNQTTKKQIIAGCLLNRERLLGESDEAKARDLIDEDIVDYVQKRLWLVVLSEKQETLLISDDDRALINMERTKRRLL